MLPSYTYTIAELSTACTWIELKVVEVLWLVHVPSGFMLPMAADAGGPVATRATATINTALAARNTLTTETRRTFTTRRLRKPAGMPVGQRWRTVVWSGRVGGISTLYLFVSNEACHYPHGCRIGEHRQAAYRARDVAKQCEPARTSDQLERQFRGGFRVFAQVSGLGCIDLRD